MIRGFLIIIFFLLFFEVTGQFSDDFSDGNLSDAPTWMGDTQDFLVNSDDQLQLSANQAGESTIFLETSFPDSIEWEIYFKMDFSPSGSNALKIFLLSDSNDFSSFNGYYLEVGESGSEDALKFLRSDGSSSTLLAEGSMGALGGSKAIASLKITRDQSGWWSFFADYEESGCRLLDFEVFDDTYEGGDNQFFGIECLYTSTRIDKFFFDDLRMATLMPDLQGPQISSFSTIDNQTLALTFDEFVDENSALDVLNYTVNSAIGNPSSIQLVDGKSVILSFDESFVNGIIYEISVSGILDLFQNVMDGINTESFFLAESPQPGEILINEILFNPYPERFDFIEFYNRSEKFINLEGAIIQNTQRDNDFVEISGNVIL